MKSKAVILAVFCSFLLGACAGMSIFSGAGREFDKGLALFNTGNYGEANAHFLRAVELDPDYAKAHLYLGRTYLSQGQWIPAVQSLRRAYDLSPYETRKEALNFLMDALLGASTSELKAGNFQEAIGYLREGMGLDPLDKDLKPQLAEALIAYGGELMTERNLDKAINNYQEALSLMPGSLEALVGLARAFLQDGELMKAASFINQAQKIDPNSDIVRTLLNQLLKMQ